LSGKRRIRIVYESRTGKHLPLSSVVSSGRGRVPTVLSVQDRAIDTFLALHSSRSGGQMGRSRGHHTPYLFIAYKAVSRDLRPSPCPLRCARGGETGRRRSGRKCGWRCTAHHYAHRSATRTPRASRTMQQGVATKYQWTRTPRPSLAATGDSKTVRHTPAPALTAGPFAPSDGAICGRPRSGSLAARSTSIGTRRPACTDSAIYVSSACLC